LRIEPRNIAGGTGSSPVNRNLHQTGLPSLGGLLGNGCLPPIGGHPTSVAIHHADISPLYLQHAQSQNGGRGVALPLARGSVPSTDDEITVSTGCAQLLALPPTLYDMSASASFSQFSPTPRRLVFLFFPW
jgi:hypothetical protein